MPFPNHPQKYESDPLVTPERSREYMTSADEEATLSPPEAVILCYSRALMDALTTAHEGEMVDQYFGDLYLFADADNEVGVLGNFGIGAPTTAMLMEELIADGVETFLSIGYAGCLDDSIEMGEIIVCDRAIRDEGTSHHYVPPGEPATPTASLRREIEETLRRDGETIHVGPTWTTDAVFQETTAELERYASEGVLTVEMEASTVFTVADHRGVDAASLFVVSDYLRREAWEPKFHEVQDDLNRLGELSKMILRERHH